MQFPYFRFYSYLYCVFSLQFNLYLATQTRKKNNLLRDLKDKYDCNGLSDKLLI